MKLLFHYPILNTGGAERSSLRMMKALADRGWEITLVVTTGGGTLERELDPRVRLVRLRPAAFGQRFLSAAGWPAKVLALPDLLAYILSRAVGVFRQAPFLMRRYDAAAVLLQGTSTWFCRRIVRAGVRLHWIRNDLAMSDPDGSVVDAIRSAASEIDYYVCVSKVAHRSLLSAVPAVADKAHVVYNILDQGHMLAKIGAGPDPFPRRGNLSSLRILTVCRLKESAKGLVRMARVCRALVDAGLDFQWLVVGDGNDRPLLEREIDVLGIGDRMTLSGTVGNPFPAYAHADVVAMLSNYEGLSGVVNEAKTVGCPVLATCVSGIDEQLVENETGLIVENDQDAIIAGMKQLLTDPLLRERLANDFLPADLRDDNAKLDTLEKLFRGVV